MRYLLSFIVVIISIFGGLFWLKTTSLSIGMEEYEVILNYILTIIFLFILPIVSFVFYHFSEDNDLAKFLMMMTLPIFMVLAPSYYILFGDVNCNLNKNKNKNTIRFRIAYKDTINDIVYFNSKNKKNRGNDYMENICKNYHSIQQKVEKQSEIDYQDNVVNSLIFDAAYNKNYYQIKDIGEKEYKRKQKEIINEIHFLIK